MAYANLVLESCTTKVEWFCKMRDFLCKRNGTYDYSTDGIGWTLYDSSYATDEDNPAINDYFVIYSDGLTGDDDMYMKVTWISGYIKVEGWVYWNNSTHAGVRSYSTQNNLQIAETGNYELSVYGDLDFCYVWETLNNATYDYMAYWGRMADCMYDDTVASSTGALSSGSDVTITVDAVPSSWEVGHNIAIRDNATIDIIEIKTIPNGTSITADLDYSFGAEVKLATVFPYIVKSSNTAMTGNSPISYANHGTSIALSPYEAAFWTPADPDILNDVYPVAIPWMAGTDTFYGKLPYIWRVDDTGLTQKSALTSFDGSMEGRMFRYYSSYYYIIKEV